MDRPIPDRDRRLRRWRTAGVTLAAVAGVVLLAIALPGWIRPSVRLDRIRTARVERGEVTSTVTASGTVVPLYEHVVACPIDTRVVRILCAPGDTLASGDPIVELDVGATELALRRLEDRIALKRNERERAGMELDRQLDELRAQREVKALELKSAEFEADRNRQYYDMGLFSLDEVRRAETDAEKARIELGLIDESLAGADRLRAARLDGLDLEASILDKERAEAAERLRQARPAADHGGVVTSVVDREGASLRVGDEIARVADLSSFRLEATLSDVHASSVRAGQPVTVRTGDVTLGGRVASVRPTVENGLLTLDVSLDEPAHPALRNHLRVDAHVVTDRREGTLYVKRGVFLNIDGRSAVFVVRGDVARRTFVELGLSSFESYEILAGLSEGDEVIVSDMSDFRHVEEVRLR